MTYAQRISAGRMNAPMPDRYVEVPQIPDTKPVYELTLWEKVRLLPFMFQLLKGLLMKDAKTTVTALVGATAYVLNSLFGIGIPQDAIIAVTVFVLGLFAGDSTKD